MNGTIALDKDEFNALRDDMTDVRIAVAQIKQSSEQTLAQVTATNGRVTALESFRNTSLNMAKGAAYCLIFVVAVVYALAGDAAHLLKFIGL